MDMNSCVAVSTAMIDTDRDQLLSRVDQLIASGIPADRAQMMAATDMLAEIEADRAELERLVNEQHPDLNAPVESEEPVEPEYESRFFALSKRQTDTPEFRRWFGNSKVVDENGEPLVVYHGTGADFTVFDASKTFDGGFYFTPNEEYADEFGAMRTRGDVKKIAAYLAIKNPLEIDAEGVPFDEDMQNRLMDEIQRGKMTGQFDGVVVRNLDALGYGDESDMWIAFRPEQIKSAIGNNGNFDPNDPDIRRSKRQSGPGFYSALGKEIAKTKTNAAPPAFWRDAIKGLVNKGLVKQDEVEWSGINDWLGLQSGKVKKEDVEAYLDGNGVRVEEVVLVNQAAGLSWGDWSDRDEFGDRFIDATTGERIVEDSAGDLTVYDAEGEVIRDGVIGLDRAKQIAASAAEQRDVSAVPKYGQYVLPGGENYREVLLTLPGHGQSNLLMSFEEWLEARGLSDENDEEGFLRRRYEAEARHFEGGNVYRSRHWDQPNILAHIRLNDRTDADGKRVLFVEEIQSDWAQEGKKKGLAGTVEAALKVNKMTQAEWDSMPAEDQQFALEETRRIGLPPTAPFIDKTDKWVALALKRVIKMAVDEGYDRVAFVNGEQAATRFSLDKRVDALSWESTRTDGAARNVQLDLPNQNPLRLRVDGDGAVLAANGPGFLRYEGKALDEVIGKELAEKVLQEPSGRLSGDGLKIEAKGMRVFYDQIVPASLKTLLKKVGGDGLTTVPLLKDSMRKWDRQLMKDDLERLGEGGFKAKYAHNDQPGFDITDKMRASVSDGLPLFSKRQGGPGNFQLRRFGLMDEAIESIQDRYNRWKQAIEDVRAQGGTVTETNNFYLAEERYWGIVGAQIEDFNKEVEDWIGRVVEDGLTVNQVALYAYAQHAPDRNAYIASIRPNMPDGGSGMTNAEAQQIIDDARQAGLDAKLQAHADQMRAWIQGTRDVMFTQNLITAEDYTNWTLGMSSWVPLRGLPENADWMNDKSKLFGTGQGFNIRGNEAKAALGRRSKAKQIVENIIADRHRALIRAGKNEVGRSFLQFALDNPSPNLWEINKVVSKPVLKRDTNGDLTVEDRDVVMDGPETLTVKDGGEEIHIVIKDERLRKQLQNLNAEQLGRTIGVMLMANRWLSRIYTSLSPVFTIINAARDLQTATFGAIDEIGFSGAARLWLNVPKSFMEAMNAEVRGKRSADFELYRATGGKTGFFDFKTIDDLTNDIESMVSRAESSMLDPAKLTPKVMGVIENLNAGFENTIRLAAFKAARQEGKTVTEASSFAKNVTVNFNRKGTKTPYLAAWFLFFNPAIQGTTRMIEALKSPKVLATLGGAMFGVYQLALMNAAMGEDDDGIPWWDKIPSEVKERNLIIMRPPGEGGEAIDPNDTKSVRYIKIPMPYGYNVFAVMANQIADLQRNKDNPVHGVEADKAFARTVSAFLGSWLPTPELGALVDKDKPGEMALLAAVPDFLNPVAQNLMNVNPFGRPITPERKSEEGLPDFQKVNPTQVGTIYHQAAEKINTLTGGSKLEPGLLDLSAGEVENLVRGYGGGPVSFMSDIANAIYMQHFVKRPEIDTKRLPFAKQLTGVIDDETDKGLAYERMDKANEAVKRFESGKRLAKQDGSVDTDLEKLMADEPLIQLGGEIQKTRKWLAEIRKEELAILNDETTSDAEKIARIASLAKDKRQLLQDFNRAYNAVLQAQREQAKPSSSKPAPAVARP